MKISQLLSYLALLSSAVLAANIKNLRACVVPGTDPLQPNSLQITGTYCGAGTFATFDVSATATVNQQCFNKANNQPQGQPKSLSRPINQTFDNVELDSTGCASLCFETDPIEADLICTPSGSQEARIVGPVTYTGVTLTGSNLPRTVRVTVSGTACTSTCP